MQLPHFAIARNISTGPVQSVFDTDIVVVFHTFELLRERTCKH
jgi:hypothetical protein